MVCINVFFAGGEIFMRFVILSKFYKNRVFYSMEVFICAVRRDTIRLFSHMLRSVRSNRESLIQLFSIKCNVSVRLKGKNFYIREC